MNIKKMTCILVCLIMLFTITPVSYAVVIDFEDVSRDDWYYTYASTCFQCGIFKGTSSATKIFEPARNITRAEFVATIGRAHKLTREEIPDLEDSFSDTDSGAYYSKYIARAADIGIINGYGDGRFGPDDLITREQMVTMFYRYIAELTGGDYHSTEFGDMYLD